MDKRLKYRSANDDYEIYTVVGRDDVVVIRTGPREWEPQRIDSRGRALSGIYPVYSSSTDAVSVLFDGQWEQDQLEVLNDYRTMSGMSTLERLP